MKPYHPVNVTFGIFFLSTVYISRLRECSLFPPCRGPSWKMSSETTKPLIRTSRNKPVLFIKKTNKNTRPPWIGRSSIGDYSMFKLLEIRFNLLAVVMPTVETGLLETALLLLPAVVSDIDSSSLTPMPHPHFEF